MSLMWQRGQLSVRDVHEELVAEGDDLAYSTVMTILVRLQARGLLTRVRKGKQFIYEPSINADEFHGRAARALAESLIRDFDKLAIASFVEELAKASPDRLEELRELAEKTSRRDERSD
jgi:predicted transcriptional regulator